MSLLRLLTSGKCLVTFRDSASQYRLQEKNRLPKFGASKNPFAPPQDLSPAAPVAVAVAHNPAAPGLSPAETAAARLKETKRLPAATPPLVPPAGKPPRASLSRRTLQTLRDIAPKFVPSTWRSKQVFAAKPLAAGAAQAPVQAELSLDRIKVVRNDLSDADVEIVPAGGASRKRKSAPAASANEPAAVASTRT